MRIPYSAALAALALTVSVTAAQAQSMHDHPMHEPATQEQPSSPPSEQSPAAASPLMQPLSQMQQGLVGVALTGDMDHDFAAIMMHHHQAAIAMARLEMKEGKDPKIKKLAQDIVKAQVKQICEMNTWVMNTPVQKGAN